MSQDLFAAFGDSEPETAHVHSSANVWASSHSTALHEQAPVLQDDEDDFGDFEDASTAAAPVPAMVKAPEPRAVRTVSQNAPSKLPFKPRPISPVNSQPKVGRHPFADHMDVLFDAGEDEYDAGQDEWNDLSNDPEAAMAYSKRVIQEQLDAEARAASSVPSANAQPEPRPTPVSMKPKNLDVLFDADDLSDGDAAEADEDWGDFEQANVPVQVSQHNPAIPSNPVANIETSPQFMDLLGLDDAMPDVPFKETPQTQAAAPSRKTIARHVQPAPMADDPWDDFEDTTQEVAVAPNTSNTSALALQLLTTPNNIPPPSVLLSHLASVLRQAPTTQNASSLLQSAWVLGHILAGRKLRWKRSSSLAASMRIGPAAAGGKSGMKLAGIDKSEVTKEDREVAEALTVWRAQVGKLRPVAAHVIGQRSSNKVPELAETIPVKSLKAVDGGFVAPHECALCGLKREERAGKLDEDVQDSFGGWWVNNASMHTECAEWWVTNEGLLRSR